MLNLVVSRHKIVPLMCPRSALNSQRRPLTTEHDQRSRSAAFAGMALNGTNSS